jgi:hypothetical protein
VVSVQNHKFRRDLRLTITSRDRDTIVPLDLRIGGHHIKLSVPCYYLAIIWKWASPAPVAEPPVSKGEKIKLAAKHFRRVPI